MFKKKSIHGLVVLCKGGKKTTGLVGDVIIVNTGIRLYRKVKVLGGNRTGENSRLSPAEE